MMYGVSDVKSDFEQGAQINHSDEYGMTPLHYAARRGDPTIAEYLLSQKPKEGMTKKQIEATVANPNAVDNKVRKPIDLAVEYDRRKTVKALLPKTDIDDKHMRRLLFKSVEFGSATMIDIFLPKVELNEKEKFDLLVTAASAGKLKTLQYLEKKLGFDITATGENGFTLLNHTFDAIKSSKNDFNKQNLLEVKEYLVEKNVPFGTKK